MEARKHRYHRAAGQLVVHRLESHGTYKIIIGCVCCSQGSALIQIPRSLSSVQKMIRAVTLETPTMDRLAKDPPKSELKSVTYASLASAAEYELDCPPMELTPLPSEVAKERFPVSEPVEESPEKVATEETKHNTAILAEWEDTFDSYLSSDDEESSGEELESMLFSRKNRRKSGIFSPEESLQDEDEVEVNMASLAVESPSRCLDDTPTACPQSPASTIDTTPPSDVRLEAVIFPTGGGNSSMNPSRQLHGDLERCAEDSGVSDTVGGKIHP